MVAATICSNAARYIRCQGRKNQELCWHWFQNRRRSPLDGRTSDGLLSGSPSTVYSCIADWYRQLVGSLIGRACIAPTALAYHSRIGSPSANLQTSRRTRVPAIGEYLQGQGADTSIVISSPSPPSTSTCPTAPNGDTASTRNRPGGRPT